MNHQKAVGCWLWAVVILLCVLSVHIVGGCNQHELTANGDAKIVLRGSMLDSYQAVQRSGYEETSPFERTWQQVYLAENFKQWRYFFRTVERDANAGPKLKEEP